MALGYPRNKFAITGQIFTNGGCSSWAGILLVKNNELWLEHRGDCASPTATRRDSTIASDAWRSIIIHYVVSKAGAGGAIIVLALVFGSLLAIVPLLMAAAAISTTFLLVSWSHHYRRADPREPTRAFSAQTGLPARTGS